MAETSKGLLEREKKEKTFLTKTMGPRKVSANELKFYLGPNGELYEKFQEIYTIIKKRRMAFYGQITKTEP